MGNSGDPNPDMPNVIIGAVYHPPSDNDNINMEIENPHTNCIGKVSNNDDESAAFPTSF